MIWVYAVCDAAPGPLPAGRGLSGAPVEGIAAGPLVAAVTRHREPPADTGPEAMWTHERVVEDLMASRAVLPLRFGTQVADDEELRELLSARERALLAALDAVRGRVEIGVRAIGARVGADGDSQPSDRDTGSPATGRQYVLDRLAEQRRADRAAAAIDGPLAELAVAARRLPTRAPDELLRAAYLVERTAVGRVEALVGRLQRANPGVSVLCTGPWPPYSFTSAEDEQP